MARESSLSGGERRATHAPPSSLWESGAASSSPGVNIGAELARRFARARWFLAIPTAGTAILWLFRLHEVTALQCLLAWSLLALPWGAYLSWQRQKAVLFPLFACIAGLHWLYFAVPLFLGERRTGGDFGAVISLDDGLFTQALGMALFGMVALGLGMASGPGRRIALVSLPDVPLTQFHLLIVRLVLLTGLFASLVVPATLLGAGGRQMLYALQSTVPLVAFAILFRRLLQGQAAPLDRLLLLSYAGSRVLAGLSGGWVGALIDFGLVAMAVYLALRRRLPVLAIALALVYVLFFQAGKQTFRAVYWYGGSDGSGAIERINLWIDASAEELGLMFSDESARADAVQEYVVSSFVMRVALLQPAGHVLRLTPEVVPYQHGRLYSFFFVNLIPRFIWPEKPSANEANRFYQVAYGLTDEDDLDGVSIAAGFLAESYISFGWPGVGLVLFVLGVALSVLQGWLLSSGSGGLFSAVGFALIPTLSRIESQLALYLAGLMQQCLFALLAIVPLLLLQRSPDRAEQHGAVETG